MDKTLERKFFEKIDRTLKACFTLLDNEFEEDNKNKLSDEALTEVRQNIIKESSKLDVRVTDVLNEIVDNLDECQTDPRMKVYVCELLRPFKEFSDRFHPIRWIKIQEDNINYYNEHAELLDNTCTRDVCSTYEKEIKRIIEWTNKYHDFCFTGKAFEHKKGTAERFFVELINIITLFAKRLDALLLERGYDLLWYQDQIGIYLIRQDRQAIDTDWEYLGGLELAEELIKKVSRSYNSEEQKKAILSFKKKYSVYFGDCDDFINRLQKMKARDLAREFMTHLSKSNISLKEFCDDCFILTPKREGEPGWNYENVRKRQIP